MGIHCKDSLKCWEKHSAYDVWLPPSTPCDAMIDVQPSLELAKQFETQYKDVRRFTSLYYFAPHVSDSAAYLRPVMNKPFADYLKSIDFNSTLVVLTADHGFHFGNHWATPDRQIAHRLPPLFISAPKWIGDTYPELRAHLTANQHVLMTAFRYQQNPQTYFDISTTPTSRLSTIRC